MKISQLLHAMDKDEFIIIGDYDKPINEMTLYEGTVSGIARDNPISKMRVQSICADEDTILVLATRPTEKGGERE